MRIYNQNELEEIHNSCYKNKSQIKLKNQRCGCFYCKKIFIIEDIDEWTDSKQTAMCPNCDIDSVIIETESLKISESLLKQMHNRFFNWESKI